MRNIFIISGPSGAGEDSIISALERLFPTERVVTITTRPMRTGESEGHPYRFLSREAFQEKIRAGEFFEYAEEDNRQLYGTTHAEIERIKNVEKVVLWKMDYQGVITMKKLLPEAVSVLIMAPLDILETRIRRRENVTDDFVRGRLKHAQGWFDNRNIFDYEIENEQGRLDEAIQKVAAIIKEHARP